jgi:hypothetical protein
VRISDQQKEEILRLIAEGEHLDLQDLVALYRWMDDSQEALEFYPLRKRQFEQYCRGSCDSNSTRVYVGMWILRLALQEALLERSYHRKSFP